MREATRIVRPIDMRRRFAWLAAAVGLATTTVVVAQSVGPQGPASRLVRMGEALIASHLS